MENNSGEQIFKISIEVNFNINSNKEIYKKNEIEVNKKPYLPSKFKNKSISWNSDIESKCNTILEKILNDEGKKLNISQIIMDAITEKYEKY